MTMWIQRARRMSAADHAVALEVLALAIGIEVALKVLPFSRLLQRLERPSTRTSALCGDVHRLIRFVAVAYEMLPFPATCLRQSLVLHALLRRRGVRSRVCFGVARNGGALDAHAWVECEGIAADAASARFGELRAAS